MAGVTHRREGDAAHVDGQDVRAAALVRERHYHAPRQAPRPRQRRVQHLSGQNILEVDVVRLMYHDKPYTLQHHPVCTQGWHAIQDQCVTP